MVRDDNGDCECYCGVQPVPAACGQDDAASYCHSGCRGGVGNGVKQDGRDGQIPLLLAALIALVAMEDERTGCHYHGSDDADDEYRQALHLRCAVS